MALNPKQKAFLDAYCANPIMPMAEHARNMGISENTVYGWKEKNINGFADELNDRLKRKWEEAKEMASDIMMSLAREGNYQAAKYILDYSGYAPAQKQEIKVDTTTINVKIGE